MTHIPDLARRTYCSYDGRVRPVGWLEASAPFPRAKPDRVFVDRLLEIAEYLDLLEGHAGMHWCSICAAENKVSPDCRSSQHIILVPGEDCVYEAPIWIGHYVLGHHYRPPDEFRSAVLASPKPGSMAYQDALGKHLPYFAECQWLTYSHYPGRLAAMLLPETEGTWLEYVERLRRREEAAKTCDPEASNEPLPLIDVEEVPKRIEETPYLNREQLLDRLIDLEFDGVEEFAPHPEIGDNISPYDFLRDLLKDNRTRQQVIDDLVEREGGLSDEACIFKGCSNHALSGKAVCAEHMGEEFPGPI